MNSTNREIVKWIHNSRAPFGFCENHRMNDPSC